jgi:hypothetical protein
MRSVLPWLAVGVIAVGIGWLVQGQTSLQDRIAALEARAQIGLPGNKPSGTADGPEASDPAGASETRRQMSEMRDAIQSLRAELSDARQSIVRDAEERAAATIREELLTAAMRNPSAEITLSGRTFPSLQQVPHYTGGPKRNWGHEQATGAPDTRQPGDLPTAWASKNPDGGVEWLELDYEQAVGVDSIRVHESHNPGAISKVAVIRPDGGEETVWEGNLADNGRNELLQSDFKVARNMQGQKVRVYVDTARVPGWNEIDAVQLVGRDGTQQWAVGSRASSSYSDP